MNSRQNSLTLTRKIEASFEMKVAFGPNCWLWQASKTTDGYGLFFNGVKLERAHRFSYRAFVGPIPDGARILHKCDTPACVNPAHLVAGTQAENVKDMIDKGREDHARGEGHGRAKLTEAKVLAIRADTRTHKQISADYAVSRGLVSQIKTRTIWAHI